MKIQLTTQQQSAINTLDSSLVSLLTGGPGRGKTFTLAHWLKQSPGKNTWCFAPTGKAAQQLMLAFDKAGVSTKASTIHSGLIPEKTGYDGHGWRFVYNKDNHLPCDRVIIDESSMIDCATMSWLLEAIAPRTQVVFVGDPDQLPPVGKGKPFIDMINSGKIAHAKLTEIHRFAGRIAHVCDQINRGDRLQMSGKLDLDDNASDIGPENCRHIERANGISQLRTLDALIDKVKERGFDPAKDLQVLVARNEQGDLNRRDVNRRLQNLINPKGFTVGDCPYRVGDRVMCLRNGGYSNYEKLGSKWMTLSKVYVANGETGRVIEVSQKEIYVAFGEAVCKFTTAMWSNILTLAYAITCHKSQGATIPVCVYLIDDARMIDRNLLYTAISRSKEICFTVGRLQLMNQQVKKVSVGRRKTFLLEMLTGDMAS